MKDDGYLAGTGPKPGGPSPTAGGGTSTRDDQGSERLPESTPHPVHPAPVRGGGDPPTVGRPVDSLSGASDADGHAAAMAARITRSTQDGGMTKLPVAYEKSMDWKSIKGSDPFTILYLDPNHIDRIGDDAVRKNASFIREFWELREQLAADAGGDDRDRMLRLYADGDEGLLRAYVRKVDGALGRIEESAKRQAEADQSRIVEDDLRRKANDRRFESVLGLLDGLTFDGELTAVELDNVLSAADGAQFDLEDAAARILRHLSSKGFAPAGQVSGGTDLARLRSAVWCIVDGIPNDPWPAAREALTQRFGAAARDGRVAPDEMRAMLDEALTSGAGEVAAVEHLHVLLAERGYVPTRTLTGADERDRLASASWWTPEQQRTCFEALAAQIAESTTDGSFLRDAAVALMLRAQVEGLDPEATAGWAIGELRARGLRATASHDFTSARHSIETGTWATIIDEPPPKPLWPKLVLALIGLAAVAGIIAKLGSDRGVGPGPPTPSALYQARTLTGVKLRSEPGSQGGNATEIGELPAGSLVDVISETMANSGYLWLRVRLSDGTEAWITGKSEYVSRPEGMAASVPAPPPTDEVQTTTDGGGGTPPPVGITSVVPFASPDELPPPEPVSISPTRLASQIPVQGSGSNRRDVSVRVQVDENDQVISTSCVNASGEACALARVGAENARYQAEIRDGVGQTSSITVAVRVALPDVVQQPPRPPTVTPPPPPPCDRQAIGRQLMQLGGELRKTDDPSTRAEIQGRIDGLNAQLVACI